MGDVSNILDREKQILDNIQNIQQDLAVISAQSIAIGAKNNAMRLLLLNIYSALHRIETGGELVVSGGSGTLLMWEQEIKNMFEIDKYGNPHL